MMPSVTILQGDVLEQLRTLPPESVHCCVTSPPYWGLRDYGVAGQIGLEKTPEEYVERLVEVFREVRRVLRPDGTCWINLGDSYVANGSNQVPQTKSHLGSGFAGPNRNGITGLKPKDLCGIPWRVAFALQADGWWLRQDVIWNKCNPMPESVTDRCTKSHEYIFLLSKAERYYYDAEAIKEAVSESMLKEVKDGYDGHQTKLFETAMAQNASDTKRRIIEGAQKKLAAGIDLTRNKRSVWTVPSFAFNGWTENIHWVRVSAGDASGGMRRIVSRDCPVHGCLDLKRGGHATVFVPRNPGNETRPDLELGAELACNSKHPAQPMLESSPDCSDRSCSEIANPHSNQIHKTDPAPATNPSCNASVEIVSRIADKQELLGSFDSAGRTLGSSIWPADLDDHLWEQIPYRTVDKSSSSCRCVIYKKIAEKASHFATYPTDLIKPCILAGTSARGCCPKCGAPRERISQGLNDGTREDGNARAIAMGHSPHGPTAMNRAGEAMTKVTFGWQPTCECSAKALEEGSRDYNEMEWLTTPVPCTVLDPFAGSFTTCAVALELGRNAIGIELNPSYVKLGRERCAITPGLNLA